MILVKLDGNAVKIDNSEIEGWPGWEWESWKSIELSLNGAEYIPDLDFFFASKIVEQFGGRGHDVEMDTSRHRPQSEPGVVY